VAEVEQQQEAETPVDFDAETDEAIALCGGDVRAALKATLIANAFLEKQIETITEMLSAGYGRGQVRKPARAAKKAP
jgi:hypothetical protein